ncbi:MAG TPA: GDSL-type esterase/lipase family protein [Bryobacteraceae bacterium]|nr:GDSL-type esterase/lipase family protein [Bryobacteraceae bacterium]
MKQLFTLVCAATALAQTPGPAPSPLLAQKDLYELAVRTVQLMESTGVAVNGLLPATDTLRHNTAATIEALRRTPQSLPLHYQLLNQVRAFLAVAATFPNPATLPQTAAAQLTELHDAADRLQRHFDALLVSSARTQAAREADPNNLKRYADANSKLLAPGKPPRVVFYGDSITDFWRLNEYFPGRDFVNRGISGQTTTQMLGRFLQDVVSLRPKAVVILAGTNDLARGIPVNGIEDNLAMMAALAKANGIQPLFASILPVSDYHKDTDPRYEMTAIRPPSAILKVNEWMKQFCQREGFTYVDYHTAMADTNGQLPADEADDGLHPNAKGYRIMSPVALSAVDRVLAMPAPSSEAPAKRRFGFGK